jgi:hypothetical protein
MRKAIFLNGDKDLQTRNTRARFNFYFFNYNSS